MRINARLRAELREAKGQILRAYAGQRHFNGAGIGFRTRNGEQTDEPVVIVAVTKKRPPGYVASDRLLPRYVDVGGRRLGVDVIQGGPFRGAGDPEFNPPDPVITERFRPLAQGCSIKNVNRPGTGTLGCFVRDLTDDTWCILSNNHVLVRGNSGQIGDPIVQPGSGGSSDIVAHLKRFIPYTSGTANPNIVDAAIAQLTDDQGSVDTEFPGDRMPEISVDHPAVGLWFGADPFNGIGFIAKMDNVLDEIGVELLGQPAAINPLPDIGEHIEKVGYRTGYTSSTVNSVDWTIFVVQPLGTHEQSFWFTDLIMTDRFGWPGDSGSVVCIGGDGDTRIPLDILPERCQTMDSVGGMYDLPLSSDHGLADQVRDEFFALSKIGNFLTQMFYVNSEVIVNRTQGREASAEEKSGAASLYNKYHDFLIGALADPNRPDLVVTQEHLDDAASALSGMQLQMTQQESDAATNLYNTVMRPTLGMNHQQLIGFMNDEARYRQVWDIIAPVPTLKTHGQIRGGEGPR